MKAWTKRGKQHFVYDSLQLFSSPFFPFSERVKKTAQSHQMKRWLFPLKSQSLLQTGGIYHQVCFGIRTFKFFLNKLELFPNNIPKNIPCFLIIFRPEKKRSHVYVAGLAGLWVLCYVFVTRCPTSSKSHGMVL